MEVLGAISLATDLGMGQPMEKGLRTALMSLALARRMGMGTQDLADVYYIALLIHLGCTATGLEWEHLSGGNDIEMRAGLISVISAPVADVPMLVAHQLLAVAPEHRREDLLAAMMAHPNGGHELLRAQCEAGVLLGRGLGLAESLCVALGQVYERWDGQGDPAGLAGEAIDARVRVVQVAHDAEVLIRTAGADACIAELRSRTATGGFDPGVVDAFCAAAGDIMTEVPADDVWAAAVAAEPSPRLIDAMQLDGIVLAFGQFADLKSPYLLGHSAGVAALAHAAALAIGTDEREAHTIARAAHVHDIGRVGVVNGVWDKPGALTESERERVRLHPYYSERVLSRSGVLAPLAGIAAAHHERMDGSGYHQHLDASRLSTAARLLAAADAYQACTQARSHRPPLSPAQAAAVLREGVERGALDRRAAGAVLEAAGQARSLRRGSWPAGLSDREVEVMRLLCGGMTARETAERLHLSPKTVGRHVENIYAKTGVSTRASLAVFAVQHGVLG